MNALRIRNAGVLLAALALYAVSRGHEGLEGYLFPHLIAIALCVLGAAILITEWPAGKARADEDGDGVPWGALWPALVVLAAYLAVLEHLGFFVSSVLVFVAIAVVYYPQRRWSDVFRRCLVVAVAFMAVLYAVFVLLLRVQIPSGILI